MHAEAAPQPGKRMILDPPATMSSTALHMTSTALLQRAGGGWVWCRRPGEVLDAVEVRVLDGRDARIARLAHTGSSCDGPTCGVGGAARRGAARQRGEGEGAGKEGEDQR